MVTMGKVATVTSKSMITIPAQIRRRFRIRAGAKMEFVEVDGAILLVPVVSLAQLRGVFKGKEGLMERAIRELESEHRQEAAEE